MCRSWKAALLAVGLAGGLTAPAARAGLLPVSYSVIADGTDYRWTYGVVLTSDSELHPGDFFTIYDFAGYVPGSEVAPEGFTFRSTLTGATPVGTVPVDDPNIPNLTWTYNGPVTTLGQVGLGNFWAVSHYGQQADGFFTARTHRQVDGRIDSNITDTQVPVPQETPLVPEPGSLTLVGLGLPLAALRLWRRRAAATCG